MGSFGTSSMGGGMRADRPARSSNTSKALSASMTKARPKPKLQKMLPEVWRLVKPRIGLLSFSFLLMVINRGASFVLPLKLKPLVDQVMGLGQMQLLPRIIGEVVGATLLQGITSYALTQMLSKGGQRLISELRTQVQEHIG